MEQICKSKRAGARPKRSARGVGNLPKLCGCRHLHMGRRYGHLYMCSVRAQRLTAETVAGISGHALSGQIGKGAEKMARRHKRRLFTGAVCTQIVYTVSDGADKKTSKPRKPRFQTQAERDEFNSKQSLDRLVALMNANFSPTSLYSTLTLDAENEVHTAEEMRRVRDNLVRRMQYHYLEAKIVVFYGRGKTTNRFHLHLVTEGIPEEAIGELWGLGSVIEVRHLRKHNYYIDEQGNRVDHGQDYTALASYLHAHWRKEFGGHRYKATRNCIRPEPEPATEAVREYSPKRPPVAPRGYILVEARTTKYGYQYYKYVVDPKEHKRNGSRLN